MYTNPRGHLSTPMTLAVEHEITLLMLYFSHKRAGELTHETTRVIFRGNRAEHNEGNVRAIEGEDGILNRLDGLLEKQKKAEKNTSYLLDTYQECEILLSGF